MLISNSDKCNGSDQWDTIRKQCVPIGTKAAKYDGNGGWYVPGTNITGGSSTGGSSSGSSTPTTTYTNDQQAPSTSSLNSILDGTNLSAEERQAIQAVYNAVAAGDAQTAQQMIARLELAAQYADPMLQRQIRLITGQLDITMKGMDQNLEYQEGVLKNQIQDLREDISYNKEQLSLQEQSELKKLDQYFGEKLIETRDTMAARGMTFSRKRERAEELLSEQKGDLVESTTREFGVRQHEQDTALQRGERDTQIELQRLYDMNQLNLQQLGLKIEGSLGSERAGDIGGLPTIGGIEGQVDIDYRDTLAGFAF